MAEFTFNNKVYTTTKMSLFQVNYGRELRMGFDIRKKGKNEKVKEFAREMKERHEKARAALVKLAGRDEKADRQKQERDKRIQDR